MTCRYASPSCQKSLTSDWQILDREIQKVSRTAFRLFFRSNLAGVGQIFVCRGRALAAGGAEDAHWRRGSSQGPRSKQHASLPKTSAIQRPPSSSFEHFSMTRWDLTYCDPCLAMLAQTPAIREEASTYRHTRLARLVCAGLPLGNLSGTPAHAPTSS